MKRRDRAYIDKLAQRAFIALIPKNSDYNKKELIDKATDLATDYFWRRYEVILDRVKKDLSPSEALRLILELDGNAGGGIDFHVSHYKTGEPLKEFSNDNSYGGGRGKSAGQEAVKHWLENNEEPLFRH